MDPEQEEFFHKAHEERRRESFLGAVVACIIMGPVFAGIGWLSDGITRSAVAMIAVSHGQEIPAIVREPMWPEMVAPATVIYLIACAIVLLLAWTGLFGPRIPLPPFPPRKK